jgi:hypothetical protein
MMRLAIRAIDKQGYEEAKATPREDKEREDKEREGHYRPPLITRSR